MKAGILGGTFDPVHNGHIKMAEYALKEFCLDKVIFVPNGNPPHKKEKQIEDFSHRKAMLELAIKNYDGFCISDYENRSEYSYSLNTMRHFRKLYGADTYFIIGADSLYDIDKWYEYKQFLCENRFIVFKRSGTNQSELDKCIKKYEKLCISLDIAQMPEVDVSSTDIRTLVLNNGDARLFVAPCVMDYINKNGLYGG